LDERRKLLIAERRPHDLRSWVECYVLPILEQGEMEGSHYLSFIAMLQQHGQRDFFSRMPERFWERTRTFREQVGASIPQIPEPLRTHRLAQSLAFSVHAASVRERARESGQNVLSFAVHIADLLDGLVGFLEAPVSDTAMAALGEADPGSFSWLILP